MKRKLKGVLGIGLTLVLLAGLTVGLSVPAGADPGKLKFTTVPLPEMGEDGRYVLTPGADVGPIATTPEGEALFATATGLATLGASDGNTATWSTTESYSGSCSALLDHNGGALKRAWVEFVPTGAITLAEFVAAPTSYGFCYWRTEDKIGPQLELTFTDGSLGWVELTAEMALYDYVTDDDIGQWIVKTASATEQCQFFGDDSGGNGYTSTGLGNLSALITDIATQSGDSAAIVGAWEMTKVIVDCGWSGDTQTAYVDDVTIAGDTYDMAGALLFKSTDGGYTWKAMEGFTEPVVDIVTSPDYAGDNTVFVATEDNVFQSVDGGEDFTTMTPAWTGAEVINDLDVTIDNSNRLALIVGTATGAYAGEVYVYAPATTGMAWKAQNIGTYDVLAAAFSPFFADDEGIVAVVTDAENDNGTIGRTYVLFAFGYTADGGGWGVDYGDARIRDPWDSGFTSTRARIAFPDDFDAEGVGNNVLFVGIYAGTCGTDAVQNTAGGERGDVYQITIASPPFSRAVDLDMRGVVTTLNPTETNIWSLDISGDAEAANMIAGTDYWSVATTPAYFLTYRSDDSGESWIPSGTKSPTGADGIATAGAKTNVLMSYNFLDSEVAYAGTSGTGTSGFSRSDDSGATWNQISLIDYGDPTTGYTITPAVIAVDATGYNVADTLHMVTQVAGASGAVWKTNDAGKTWERIWSYANPGVSAAILEVYRIGEETIFCTDFAAAKIYRSSDMGRTWPKKITTKTGLTEVKIVSETTIYTGQANGDIWYSIRSGAAWQEPDENEAAGRGAVGALSVYGDSVLAGNFNGTVFLSSDAGETFEKLAVNNPGGTDDLVIPTFDLAYAANNYAYSTVVDFSGAPVGRAGVWRIEIDAADPDSTRWERIDDIQDPTPYNYVTVSVGGPAISLPPSGVLYVIDGATADNSPDVDVAGGIWRCTNPTADIDGAHPPYFEKETRGLTDGVDILQMASLDVFPTTFFCVNVTAPYNEQLVTYTDTLDVGVSLADPGDGATGVGLIAEGAVYPELKVAWAEMAGATSYQWQLAYDPDFTSVSDSGFTDSLISAALTLAPNRAYYWRVRVADYEDTTLLVGAPLISPWAEVWKFKTAIGAVKARPELEAPEAGFTDIALSPTFEWSGIEWAEKYEFELATDPGTTAGGYFAAPLVALTGTNALVSTAWKCDITLDYNTRYYWHVKAFGVDTETPWSDVGTFVTMAVPPEPVEPVPPIVVPPQEVITPGWIWAIVIIGAILVIAVVVLIVTTRRTP